MWSRRSPLPTTTFTSPVGKGGHLAYTLTLLHPTASSRLLDRPLLPVLRRTISWGWRCVAQGLGPRLPSVSRRRVRSLGPRLPSTSRRAAGGLGPRLPLPAAMCRRRRQDWPEIAEREQPPWIPLEADTTFLDPTGPHLPVAAVLATAGSQQTVPRCHQITGPHPLLFHPRQ